MGAKPYERIWIRSTTCLLAVSVILLVAEKAPAPGCAVYPFSQVKQRTLSPGAGLGGADVTTLIDTPIGSPGDTVTLETDPGCFFGDGFDPVKTNNTVTFSVQRTNSAGTAFDVPATFDSYTVPDGNVEIVPESCPEACVTSPETCNETCSGLRITLPALGYGPTRITVVNETLAGGAGAVVAQIFELAVKTSSCDVDSIDTIVRTFTTLTIPNVVNASPPPGTSNLGFFGVLDGNGNLLVPLRHTILGTEAVDATVTRTTSADIDLIPSDSFLRSLTKRGRTLPAIHRLTPFGGGKAMFATTDVARSVLQIFQADPDPSSSDVYPTNFHTQRIGPSGAVLFLNPVQVVLDGASPVVALRASKTTVATAFSEAIGGDINGDGDSDDLIVSATDLPSGTRTDTNQALAEIATSSRVPVVDVEADVVAFAEGEAASGYVDQNLDGDTLDLIVRVLKGGAALNATGAPNGSTLDTASVIDGTRISISDDFVFYRSSEQSSAATSTTRASDMGGFGGNDTSENPSLDRDAGHVLYQTRAADLAVGTGPNQDILVTDLDTGAHTVVAAGNDDSFDPALSPNGYSATWASNASDLATIASPGGGTQVVWERSLDVSGFVASVLGIADFTLEPGPDGVPGVDYSDCTDLIPGLELFFAHDIETAPSGSFTSVLRAGAASGCDFVATISGTFTVSPAPLGVGSMITLDGTVDSFTGDPPLPPGLTNLAFHSELDVVAADGSIEGRFDMLADTGVANTATQIYAVELGGSSAIEVVSVDGSGFAGDGDSGLPVNSEDGQFVAFESTATNLLPGAADTNGVSDVFLRDRSGLPTQRVSVTNGGSQSSGGSFAPSLTPDAGQVAFSSDGVLRGLDVNGLRDVYVRSISGGSTELVSVNKEGNASFLGSSDFPDISDDGRYVAFESGASDLVEEDTNGVVDVFVRDRVAGTTERVSTGTAGLQSDGGSFGASISRDGRFVVFSSGATNLVPDASPGTGVYRYDRVTGATEEISVGDANGGISVNGDASGNGLTVAFDSDASLVLPNDSLPVDVFVRSVADGVDQNGDGDGNDTVFQAFSAVAPTGLQPGANLAASFATTNFGRALIGVPEAGEANTNANAVSLIAGSAADGDGDTLDTVLWLYDGASDQAASLGTAGPGGSLSNTAICGLADEAQQNSFDLNADGDATDLVLFAGLIADALASSKSLTNVGMAAGQVLAAGDVCAFTLDEAGEGIDANGDSDTGDFVLHLYEIATGSLVNVGLPTTAMQLGPDQELLAFRVDEAAANGEDLNVDGDGLDEVMHLIDLSSLDLAALNGQTLSASDVANLGRHGDDCDKIGCEAFPFAKVIRQDDGALVSFLGNEPSDSTNTDECSPTSSSFCDWNSDGDGIDTVVHLMTVEQSGSGAPDLQTASSLLVGEDSTSSPLPSEGPQGTAIMIQMTECEAAAQRCGTTIGDGIEVFGPPISTCAAEEVDLDESGDLDCETLRTYASIDSDGDLKIDVTDQGAIDTPDDGTDTDDDGVPDATDNTASLLPCMRGCDIVGTNDVIDQLDIDIILAKATSSDQRASGFPNRCGDQRDVDDDLYVTIADFSICKSLCDVPYTCTIGGSGGGGGGEPEPATGGYCGLGFELALLLPLLGAWRRRRRIGCV